MGRSKGTGEITLDEATIANLAEGAKNGMTELQKANMAVVPGKVFDEFASHSIFA